MTQEDRYVFVVQARYALVVQAVEDYLWGFDPDGAAVVRATSLVDEIMDAILTAGREIEAAALEAS